MCNFTIERDGKKIELTDSEMLNFILQNNLERNKNEVLFWAVEEEDDTYDRLMADEDLLKDVAYEYERYMGYQDLGTIEQLCFENAWKTVMERRQL